MEVWKDIKNYEGIYQVSNIGTGLQHLAWHTHSHIVSCQARAYRCGSDYQAHT